MFSSIRRLIGAIKVTESGDMIKIDGLPADVIMNDIAKKWGTSKIGFFMFNTFNANVISFHKFFALDFAYVITNLINEKASWRKKRSLNKLLDELYEHTWLKGTRHDFPSILNRSKLNELKVTLLPHQERFLNMYDVNVPRYQLKGFLLGAAPGSGKAQPLDAFIKVPGGWSRMDQMKVGTEVITPKGTTTVVTGVYPQGVKDIYSITFADGRKTECCAEHYWRVWYKKDNQQIVETKTTREIMESNEYAFGKMYIPLIQPEDSEDVEIIHANGSYKQRLNFLNELLDDHGHVDKEGNIFYLTLDNELATTVQYLVRSLGGIAEKITQDKTYRISIQYPRVSELFTKPNKREKVQKKKELKDLVLGIKSIEFVGRKEAQCISVEDEDHLYITNGFIVTHNTLTCISLALCLEADVIIGIVPKNAVYKVWVDTLKERFKKIPSYWDSLSGEPLVKGKRFYFFHYEQQQRAVDFFKINRPSKPMILLDESHNFNEITSFRTKLFIDLCAETHCEHVIWSSGTLLKAIGAETLPMLKTLDSMFTSDVEARFAKMFGKNAKRAVDILRNRLGLISFKVNKSDLMDTRPKYELQKITIPNGNDYTLDAIRTEMRTFIEKQLKLYKDNMKSYVKRYEMMVAIYEKTIQTKEEKNELKQYRQYINQIIKGYDPVAMKQEVIFCNNFELKKIMPKLPPEMKPEFKSVRSIVKYYQLKVQGEALGRILGKKRMECNVAMVPHSKIENIIDASEKKTIIFTSYVEVVDACYEYLTKLGYRPLRVYGETNHDLVNIVNDFGKNEDANPLIATYKSLSSAVPLVMANTLILMNSPFRSYEEEQAVSRCDRIGQDKQVYVWNMVLDTGKAVNISTRALDILNWSREQVSEIMGIPIQGKVEMSVESFCLFIEGSTDLKDINEVNRPSWASWGNDSL